jgi:hypothetical protein
VRENYLTLPTLSETRCFASGARISRNQDTGGGKPYRSSRLLILRPRQLVWREDSTFTAWGCKPCRWILVGSGSSATRRTSKAVWEAFDKYDCARFARIADGKAKRPRD